MMKRFKNWKLPKFNKKGITRWNWMCQYHENLKLGKNSDIGAFTYINAKNGVVIGDLVQVGSHCSIYSESTIDDKKAHTIPSVKDRTGYFYFRGCDKRYFKSIGQEVRRCSCSN